MAGVGVVLVLLVGVVWLNRPQTPNQAANPNPPVPKGQEATFPCPSADHIPRGARGTYDTDPPVCGPHYASSVPPGFYSTPQRPEELVHSLEHGHVVIYYDQPDATVLQELQILAARYTGHWDGVVVVPRQNLGDDIILTAWGHMLWLEQYEPEAVAAFLDAYRGRGPENPVR